MIKKQESISQLSKTKPYYRITATLLNQWERIYQVKNEVSEKEDDTISREDKIIEKQNKAYEEFLKVLRREPIEDNEYIIQGREFEANVCNGLDAEFSPIVKDGAFQVTVTKKVTIDGENILLYGVLDVLKAGRIMDIKKVVKYKSHKYKSSHQHTMYLYLVPTAIDFTYLVCDGKNYYYENYERQNCEDIIYTISQFLSWLKAHNLFETYKRNWTSKGD